VSAVCWCRDLYDGALAERDVVRWLAAMGGWEARLAARRVERVLAVIRQDASDLDTVDKARHSVFEAFLE